MIHTCVRLLPPSSRRFAWPPSGEERALAAQLRELDRELDREVATGWDASGDGAPGTELDDVEVVESILANGVDPWSLALLMSIDPASLLDPIHRVRYLQAMDAVHAYVTAGQQRALVAVAGRQSSGDLRTERHVEHEVAIARRSTRGRAGRDIEIARTLRTEFRATAGALERGEIGLEHASALVVGTRHVARREARAEIERRVLPEASASSPSRFRRLVDAAVCAVDAEDETRRRARARGDRQVWVRRIENGLGELVVIDEWSVVSGMYERITDSARDLQRERRAARRDAADRTAPDEAPDLEDWADCTLDNCRADALSDVVRCDDDPDPHDDSDENRSVEDDTGPIRRRRRAPRIEGRLVIDLATLRGEADHPCLLDGSPIPAPVGRRLARDIGHWRRMVTDPVDGHLLDYGRRTYLPGRLRTFVAERDRTCRAPWCDQPARRCQMDHAQPFPEGPSSTTNAGALCADCHRIKTERGAFLDDSAADGSATWRTAWGQRVPIAPTRYLDDGRTTPVPAPGGATVPGMLDRLADHPAPRTVTPPDDPATSRRSDLRVRSTPASRRPIRVAESPARRNPRRPGASMT